MTVPLLRVEDLSVVFPVKPTGAWPWTPPLQLQAVKEVTFDLAPGETLGIVGESGSGKSTLARAIIGTVPTSDGAVLWEGTDLTGLGKTARRKHRRDVQMIFQDPLAALNPRMTVGEIIAEPLTTHFPETTKSDVRARVQDLMSRVGLLPNLINRYPHEFSGGQCQRIGIARALILKPKLLICDEPVSALDVSVQAQVVNLLKELQAEFGLSLIFIAHDLSVVKHISTRIAVMYLGRLMETAPSKSLIETPLHPYTQILVSSVPIPDPVAEAARAAAPISGELPSPINPPSGCVFRTRCPKARPVCAEALPGIRYADNDHAVSCLFYDE
jgi:oligopeptide transport system ATP-binding protein